MFGIHSIEYDELKSFFYLFAILENGSDWLSWDHVTDLADEIGIPTVPVVCRAQVRQIIMNVYKYNMIVIMERSDRVLCVIFRGIGRGEYPSR